MASFPTSIVNPTDPLSTSKLNNPSHSQEHQSHNAEIVALETKLGTGASTPTAGKVLRATGTGVTSYGPVDVTTDVTGFTSANLRTLLSDETGTGSAVFATSPTITTPVISSIVNTGTLTLPTSTDTLVGKATSDTLTNKVINGTTNSVRSSGANSSLLDSSSVQEDIERRMSELQLDYIVSGCVWTADAVGSTRLASMTSGVVYLSGKRLTVAAVTSRTFTASKDVYVDFSDNGNGTALLTYTDNTTNAASPALTAGSLRNGILVIGATTIATTASINQGQEDRVLPIASSIPYTVTDSLGNLICPRDPNRRLLGYRQILTSAAVTNTTTVTQVTGLAVPVIIPTGRKVEVELFTIELADNGNNATQIFMEVWEGTVGSGTRRSQAGVGNIGAAAAARSAAIAKGIFTPGSTSLTYNAGIYSAQATSNVTLTAATTSPAYLAVRLA